jgi:hypothetical protein
MTGLLRGRQFEELFTSFERSARRLEVRDRYDVDSERLYLARWRDGMQEDRQHVESRRPWLRQVRQNVAHGRTYQRVRVVAEPLTEYVRYALRGTRQTVESGEDIRYLLRSQAGKLDLPDHDFWILDERRLVLMPFTADDRPLGGLVVTEPDVVAQHAAWLDLAVEQSIPYGDFLAEDPSREFPARST